MVANQFPNNQDFLPVNQETLDLSKNQIPYNPEYLPVNQEALDCSEKLGQCFFDKSIYPEISTDSLSLEKRNVQNDLSLCGERAGM